MKISVIIPAHNEAKIIAKTLRAIGQQDYSDYEIILVDNNSTDETAAVAASFPGIEVLSEKRKGTMWACECGRQAAKGEIIARLDADCLPEPDWLSRGAAYFANPKVAAVSGPYDYYDAAWLPRFSSLFIQKTVYVLVNNLLRLIGRGGITLGGNTFIRASILSQMGGFNTAITFYGDDTDTAKRAARYGRVIFSPRLTMATLAPGAERHGDDQGLKKVLIYLVHFFRVIMQK